MRGSRRAVRDRSGPRVALTVGGGAHAARAWMGRNAIHRAGGSLADLAAYDAREPVIQGCHYHEAMQAVGIEGGVSGNVVPDRVEVSVAHRFAPGPTAAEAELDPLRAVLAPITLEDGATVEIIDVAAGGGTAFDQPLIAGADRAPRARRAGRSSGWTDVAAVARGGIPATNFGPGTRPWPIPPTSAVERGSIERSWNVIDDLLSHGLDLVDDPLRPS